MRSRAASRVRDSGILGLAPGLVDAGFGSLAGLTGSLYAARFFEIDQLGLFSVFFVMFQLLQLLPLRLLLVPAQVAALDLPVSQRSAMLSRSLPVGLIGGVVAIPFVWAVVVLAPGGARADYIAFGLTTSTMILLSPLQDHLRFMLHMSERSSAAAAVSAVQFVIAMTGLVGMHFLDVPPRWIPFLSLSIANAGSLVFGVAVARPRLDVEHWPGLRALIRSGRLLLPADLLTFAGLLGTSVLVARLASTDALGSAEAARVVASPILVAGTGLGQVLWPRIMSAARTSQDHELLRSARLLTALIVVITGGYVGLTGWSYPLNVMEIVVPAAYTVAGLAAFRTVVAAVSVLGNIPTSALLATEGNVTLLVAATCSFVTQLLTAAALAPAIGGHAVPAAQATGVVVAVAVMLRSVPALRPRLRRAPAAI
jgi:O-antigen/teichoic acid export membrane protein